MTQETVTKQPAAELSTRDETPKKKQISVQELVESLKSVADDIGQISELSSEEKLLVAQFFKSLLKLMQPLTPAIIVSLSALPTEPGMVPGIYEKHDTLVAAIFMQLRGTADCDLMLIFEAAEASEWMW